MRIAGVVAGVLLALLVVASLVVLPSVRIPPSNGPHGIGTLSRHWTDTTRAGIFTSDPADRRELMVQIWYPAEPGSASSRPAPYLEDAESVTSGLARVVGVPALAFKGLRAGLTNAFEGVAVAPARDRYRVLIHPEGLGGFRQSSTFRVEELVSQGYVVVALDQPLTSVSVTFPDGRMVDMSSINEVRPLVRQSYLPVSSPPVLHGQVLEHSIIPFLAQDVSFVLDQLEGRDADVADNRAGPMLTTGRRTSSPDVWTSLGWA